jgi:predicted dehydrogenase
VEAVSRVAVVGLGYWGPNLARNFDELGDLAWLCDLDDDLRRRFADRYPHARTTADFAEVLADDDLDGVVLSTPVATHYALSKQALQAGKHVLVEKPPAMRAAEAEELVAIAE